MAYNAGTAFLQVIPSFRDFEKTLGNDVKKMGQVFGKSLSDEIGQAFSGALDDTIKDFQDRIGKDLAKGLTKGLEKASKDGAGAATAAVTKATAEGVRKGTERGAKDAEAALRKRAEGSAGFYANAFRRRMIGALGALEDFAPDVDLSKAEKKLSKLREQIGKTLDQQSAGLLDEDAVTKRLTKLAKDLQKVVDRDYGIEVTANADAARQEVASFFRDIRTEQERVADELAKQARIDSARAAKLLAAEQKKAMEAAAKEAERGAKRAAEVLEREAAASARKAAAEAEKAFGETWAGRIRKGLISAFSKLPDLGGVSDLGSEAESIRRLRDELKQLSGVRVGIDLDDLEFRTRIQQISEQLREINGKTAEIDVRADTGSALRELTAVLALAGVVDRENADVKVKADTSSARREMSLLESAVSVNLSRLQNLIALGASIGLAIVPAAAAATSAIGFLGTAAAAAGAGIGVMILGFQGVVDAVKALNQAELDAEKTAKSLGKAAIGVANAQDSIRSAERGLASARLDAAEAARRSAKAVADAERDVGDARREAAEAAETAARRVVDAQRDLGRAERDSRAAREELTQSYIDARRAYEDLTSSIKSNSLSERQSILDVAEAKKALDRIIANPRATEAEREQAAITYEREVLQLADIRRRREELAEQQAQANAKGIEGSDQVRRARERVADADARVADAVQTLGDALAEQNQQRLTSARAIADAEAQLAEARIAQDIQARKSADSLVSATQALASAQRSLESQYLTSAAAGGDALENLNEAMAVLSPTAQRFARFIFELKDEFLALKFAASDGMLAGAQTAIENLLPGFEGLRGFVADVSAGLGNLFIRMSEDLRGSTFGKFFDYLKTSAVPTMDRLYTISSNLAQGFINLFLAFTPFNDMVGGGLEELTERFRVWSETLDTNQGFQKFLDYVSTEAPKVWNLLTEGARFIGDIVHAAAPIGSIVVTAFEQLLEWINAIPQDTLTAIVAGISGVAVGLTVLGAATAAYALGTAGAIVAAVGAYVTAIGVLYTNSETFRDGVQMVFNAVLNGALWLWENGIKPAAKGIGDIFMWLWNNVIKPVGNVFVTIFTTIGNVWKDLYENYIKPYVNYIVALFKGILFPIFMFLWNSVVKPVFENITVIFNVFKAVVQVVFGVVQLAFKALAAVVSWFYNIAVKPIFDKLGDLFNWLAGVITKHVAPQVEKGMGVLSKIFDKLKDFARIPIKFIIETVFNNGLLAGYNKLAKTFKVKPDDVRIPLPQGFASGGILPGFTPGRDVHDFYSPTGGRLRLSGGEGIMRPELTRALGKDWLDSGNRAARSGGSAAVRSWLMGSPRPGGRRRRRPGEGDGLGDMLTNALDKAKSVVSGIVDLVKDPAGGLRKLADSLFKLVPNVDSDFGKLITAIPRRAVDGMINLAKSFFGLDLGGEDLTDTAMSGGNSLGGVAGMMAVLHTAFPGLRLISGLRPGDRTLNGSLSYHGFNRAVDLPPMREVAAWIRKNYGKGTRELITPWRDMDLWNGRDTSYSEAIHQQHSGGNAHVHWAYDSGGIMPPGYGRWFNGTGKPEAVLTNEQWNNVARLVGHVEGRGMTGNTYNFEFRDTTLTAGRLRAIQNRDDTYLRLNRPG